MVRPSPHLQWYTQILPSAIPITLIGSTVYIALQLLQTHLSRERFLDDARIKVAALENELDRLRREQQQPAARPPRIAERWYSWFPRT